MAGWIKLWRKTMDNPVVMKTAYHLSLWVWLLCKTDNDGGITTADIFEAFPDIPKGKFYRILSDFEADGMIRKIKDGRKNYIYISKWGYYQQRKEEQSGDKSGFKRFCEKYGIGK